MKSADPYPVIPAGIAGIQALGMAKAVVVESLSCKPYHFEFNHLSRLSSSDWSSISGAIICLAKGVPPGLAVSTRSSTYRWFRTSLASQGQVSGKSEQPYD